MTRVGLIVLMLAGACTNDGESATERPSGTQKGIVVSDADKDVYVVTDDSTLLSDRLPDILADAKGDYWWAKVEVLKAEPEESTAGLGFDLTIADGGVSFSQVYPGNCNPADPSGEPKHCWLYESYTAGDEGLSGEIQVAGDSDGVSYFVQWRGITDRFEGPPQPHGRTIRGGFAIEVKEDAP